MTPHVGARAVAIGQVLHDVTFSLPAGSCTAVLGTNGAGKSTLMAAIAGLLPPDEGEIFCPRPSGYLPESAPLDPWIKIGRWLAMMRTLPGWDPAVGDELARALELPRKKQVAQLSQGQRVRLGLTLTLGRRLPVYLLDDPFLGLDPMAQVIAERFIARRSADATVLLANQDAAASERLCSHLLFLKGGTVAWCAPIEAWRARFRRVRVLGSDQALSSLGVLVLHAERRGRWTEALLDDPAETAEARLRAAGARVEPIHLPLDELLMSMVAA